MAGLLGLLAACGAPGEPVAELEASDAVDLGLEDVTAPELDVCAPGGMPLEERTLSVRVALGEGVAPDSARAWLRGAASAWKPYGLRLVQVGSVERLPMSTLLPLERAGVQSAPSLSEVVAPARALLAQRHRVDDDLHVVVFSRLAPPGGVVRGALGNLRGLTLTPATLPSDDPRAALVAAVDLEAFTPTVFVGIDEAPSTREPRGLVLAHEIGHALGLAHHPDRSNLMASQRRSGCQPMLDDAQLATAGLR